MASRSRAPSPERGCSRASRPTVPSSTSTRCGRTGSRAAAAAAASSSLADDALSSATTQSPLRVGAPNPQVQAIRLRVNELVRRYDEALAEDASRSYDADNGGECDDDNDEDEGDDVHGRRRRLPVQWKVGDVLLAAHSALARTGARTERAMVAELAREDSEVAEAMSHGEKGFSQALEAAAQRAQQTHEVLARSLAMVQQLQEEAMAVAISSAESDKPTSASDDRALQRRTRELRSAVDALNKEKQALLAQLQEQLKAHREALAVSDEQTQALKRAQHALSLKTEELRAQREDSERRAGESAQALEAAQQLASNWREKHQLVSKSGSTAEGRAQELDVKCRALSEELTRVNALLTTRTQEVDVLKDAIKESETARLRAVSEAQAAAETSSLAKAQAESSATSRSNASKRAQAAAVEEAMRALTRENRELAERVERAEADARAVAARLSEAMLSKQQFENDNHELVRVVREMQERARLQQQQPKPLAKRSSSFSISLRTPRGSTTNGERRKASRRGSRPVADDEDDLSTTSESESEEEGEGEGGSRWPTKKRLSPEAMEAARDEEELNDMMHQVVESAFPRHEHLVDALDANIAKFEDAQCSPMRRLSSSGSASASAGTSVSGEVERVRAECAQELARMKTQYVAGLLEYKALVIEQYERRQSEEHARHRLEIERLVMLVQAKFKREMERRGRRVAQAQASLKLLYRAMVNGKAGDDAALSDVQKETEDVDADAADHGGAGPEADEPLLLPPVPLKAMLRAAILAMSSSAKRTAKASKQIAAIYKAVKMRSGAPRVWKPAPPSFIVASASSKPSPPPPQPLPPPVAIAHVACQVSASDFVPVAFAKGLKGNAVAPEDMSGVVLPSAACFPRPAEPTTPSTTSGQHRRRPWGWPQSKPRLEPAAELDLVDGAALAERVVEDMRGCLPRLPPGPSALYIVSPDLRRLLFRQLVRFFAAQQQAQQEEQEGEEEVVVVVGSPRDTPFMRRKALEGVERSRTQRRQRLARAILQGT